MRRFFCTIFILFLSCLSGQQPSDSKINSLASLTFYLNEESKTEEPSNAISFSKKDVFALWEKVSQTIPPSTKAQKSFEEAFSMACIAEKSKKEGNFANAHSLFKASAQRMKALWAKEIAKETSESTFSKASTSSAFEDNPYLSTEIKNKMRPYLISDKHPLKSFLDNLFFSKRITTNLETVKNAGFEILAKGPRSQIYVAAHSRLPKHLLKFHLDNNLKKKRGQDSWVWLVKRCEGAAKIQGIIRSRNFKHFVCAKKYLYCLPANPAPPADHRHTRHLACLLVSNMELVGEKANHSAWAHKITKEHLDELYVILSRAKGSSYRPDNINYTRNGKFAFIDTEYPTSGPDYKSIRPYLSKEMKEYWDSLVKKAG